MIDFVAINSRGHPVYFTYISWELAERYCKRNGYTQLAQHIETGKMSYE